MLEVGLGLGERGDRVLARHLAVSHSCDLREDIQWLRLRPARSSARTRSKTAALGIDEALEVVRSSIYRISSTSALLTRGLTAGVSTVIQSSDRPRWCGAWRTSA
jgi:hypothetical protein